MGGRRQPFAFQDRQLSSVLRLLLDFFDGRSVTDTTEPLSLLPELSGFGRYGAQ